ncbi:MAG: hypothetical protein R2771_03445 [Saprospiraceae bacterium]
MLSGSESTRLILYVYNMTTDTVIWKDNIEDTETINGTIIGWVAASSDEVLVDDNYLYVKSVLSVYCFDKKTGGEKMVFTFKLSGTTQLRVIFN